MAKTKGYLSEDGNTLMKLLAWMVPSDLKGTGLCIDDDDSVYKQELRATLQEMTDIENKKVRGELLTA